jgi:magnesium chelatase subunit I
VAEAVLIHRRRQRDGQAGGDVRDRDSEARRQAVAGSGAERSSEPKAGSSSAFASSSTSAANEASAPRSADENDWGYLAPEPAPTTQVKGVIPLGAKKR